MGRVRGGLIPRFLANENIPRSLVDHLKAKGINVETVVGLGLQGAPDVTVVDAAAARGLTVLTQDLDFGRIFVERKPAVQILVLRSRDPRPTALIHLAGAFLKKVDLETPGLRHALIVVGEKGHRVRTRA